MVDFALVSYENQVVVFDAVSPHSFLVCFALSHDLAAVSVFLVLVDGTNLFVSNGMVPVNVLASSSNFV